MEEKEENSMDKESSQKDENEYQNYQQQVFIKCLENAKDIVAEHGESIDVFHLALQFFEKTCSPHYHWERNHERGSATNKQKRYLIDLGLPN